MNKQFITTNEASKMLGMSRTALFKLIRSGTLKAFKSGKNYVIDTSQSSFLEAGALTTMDRTHIDHAVTKVVSEYSEALRKLGRE